NLGVTTIFNLNVNKTGGTATLAAALTSSGSLVLNGGTFDTGNNWSVSVASHVVINGGIFNLRNSTMSVQRDWAFATGTFNAGGSTVTFIGPNANQNVTSSNSSFYNVGVNKSAGSVTLVDALDTNGNFTNSLGTFNTNAQAISVGGNWNFAA